jgi:drug/metabolite transporter (DMT)-like permease
MKPRDLGLLFVLAALWGASFIFMRVAAPVLGAFPVVAARATVSGVLLLVYALVIGQQFDLRQRWRQFLLIGLLNNAIPHTLIAAAQIHLSASLAAMLNATTPIFSAIFAALFLSDRLTGKKLLGLLLGMVGVAITVGWQPVPLEGPAQTAILMMLGATCSYGLAVVYSKMAFQGVSPLVTSVGQLLSAAVMVMPFVVANPPLQPLTLTVALAVLGLAVLSTALAYLLYFTLIRNAGPTPAASVTLLIPVFTSLWQALLQIDQLYLNEIIGYGVILGGLVLILGLNAQSFFNSAPQSAAKTG